VAADEAGPAGHQNRWAHHFLPGSLKNPLILRDVQ